MDDSSCTTCLEEYKKRFKDHHAHSDDFTSTVRQLQNRLAEPKCIRPVLRRALNMLGEEHVRKLIERAEFAVGSEYTREGVPRTVGRIFLKYLKLQPDSRAIFKPRVSVTCVCEVNFDNLRLD